VRIKIIGCYCHYYVEVAVEVVELNTVDTDGSVFTVRVPSDPRFIFVWQIGLSTAALVAVQNPDWNYQGNNGIVHTWVYSGPSAVIPDGTRSAKCCKKIIGEFFLVKWLTSQL